MDGLTFDGIRSGSQHAADPDQRRQPDRQGRDALRNVKVVNWTGDKRRAVVNLGGGPRPTPKTEKGVPIYLHD